MSEDTKIDKSTIVRYLHHLGQDLNPRTVLVHRNALRLPLSKAFNIDFNHEDFSLLAKAQFHRNPPARRVMPTWSLEKALCVVGSKEKLSEREIFLKSVF